MAFKLDAQQVNLLLETNRPITLIEALPEKYYRKEHLPGAINLPHDVTDGQIRETLPDQNAEIVVYCANGPCQNSDLLSNRLLAMGYLNTVDFHEGKEGWKQAEFPLEEYARG